MWYEKAALQQQTDRWLRFAPDAEGRWQAAAAEWLTDARTALLVADAPDGLAGYALVRLQPGTPGLLPETLGVLADMALDTHRYRGGVGRTLVNAAQTWLVARGIRQMTVSVSRRSAVEQAFWRSLGAKEWMDGLWMTF
jgi:GNAT superfamily N-acetyltransferase